MLFNLEEPPRVDPALEPSFPLSGCCSSFAPCPFLPGVLPPLLPLQTPTPPHSVRQPGRAAYSAGWLWTASERLSHTAGGLCEPPGLLQLEVGLRSLPRSTKLGPRLWLTLLPDMQGRSRKGARLQTLSHMGWVSDPTRSLGLTNASFSDLTLEWGRVRWSAVWNPWTLTRQQGERRPAVPWPLEPVHSTGPPWRRHTAQRWPGGPCTDHSSSGSFCP